MKLDIGCGPYKQEGYTGIDKRDLPGVDIVHDLEVIPYPIPDGSCSQIRAHHTLEHLKPWLTVDIFNELWRIMEVGGWLVISVPYGGSPNYIQDPTHCNEFNEMTFWYFDPEVLGSGLYDVYRPKPWKIISGPTRQANSNLDVVLEKRAE